MHVPKTLLTAVVIALLSACVSVSDGSSADLDTRDDKTLLCVENNRGFQLSVEVYQWGTRHQLTQPVNVRMLNKSCKIVDIPTSIVSFGIDAVGVPGQPIVPEQLQRIRVRPKMVVHIGEDGTNVTPRFSHSYVK